MPLEAYETKGKIKEQLKLMEFASLPAIASTAQDLVKKVDTMTNFELATIVSKDPFTLAKVLDLANRRGGSDKVSLTNLEDAILSVGYGKVRAMVRQLLDMEQVKSKLRFHEQREAAAMALCTCVLAQAITEFDQNFDPHEAYTAAILRNYGKVLLSAFLIDEYRVALSLTRMKKSEDAAFRDIFGISPIELTYDLLVETKIPKNYLKTLRRLKPELLEPDCPTTESEDYLILAEFCTQIISKIFDFRLRLAKFEDEIMELRALYGHRIKITEEELFRILIELNESITGLCTKYDIDPLPPGIPEVIEARAERTEPPPPPKRASDPTGGGRGDPNLKKKPEEILLEGMEDIGRACTKRTANFDDIYSVVHRIAKEGLELDDLLFFHEEKEDAPLVVKYGPGDMFKLAKRMRVKIKGDDFDIVSICQSKMCDALIFDAEKPHIKNATPGWLDGQKPSSIVIIPFYDDNHTFALAVGLRQNGKTIALSAKTQECISHIRSFIRGVYIGNKRPPEEVLVEKKYLDLRAFNKALKEAKEQAEEQDAARKARMRDDKIAGF